MIQTSAPEPNMLVGVSPPTSIGRPSSDSSHIRRAAAHLPHAFTSSRAYSLRSRPCQPLTRSILILITHIRISHKPDDRHWQRVLLHKIQRRIFFPHRLHAGVLHAFHELRWLAPQLERPVLDRI